MPNQLLTLPVIVKKITTTKDKSFAITIETQDKSTLRADQKAQLMDLLEEYGWMAFAREDRPIDQLDVPEQKLEFKGDKSPSQRLRAVLYVAWEQAKSDEDFETYYRRMMEKFIDRVKQNLQ